MARAEFSIGGTTGDALRAHVRELSLMLDGTRVDLVELGKLYERTTRALLGMIEENGISSVRFRAAVKALDLKTQKSQLEAFVSGPGVE